MKNKGQIWYIGYIVSLFLIVIILVTDFPKMVDIGLTILFSAVFGVSHVQILHDKMMKNDADYKINVMDERNIIIKEKAGNITNMFNTITFILFYVSSFIIYLPSGLSDLSVATTIYIVLLLSIRSLERSSLVVYTFSTFSNF